MRETKKESEVEGGFEEKVGEASLGVCFLCLISSAKPPPTPNPRGVGGWCRKKGLRVCDAPLEAEVNHDFLVVFGGFSGRFGCFKWTIGLVSHSSGIQ